MGILYLVATPIGNIDDITLRAIKMLFEATVIVCEDTRRIGLLLSTLLSRYPFIRQTIQMQKHQQHIIFHDQNEYSQIPDLVNILESGKDIALVSDAGTPLISDPGYKLVSECIKRQIKVVSIPGASAFVTALTSSGLPPHHVLFLGYPPEKASQRQKLFSELSSFFKTGSYLHPIIIFYVSPHKLLRTLEDLNGTIGKQKITIARELTKIHEEVWYGTPEDAVIHFTDPKGEFVLLIPSDRSILER